jgi:hypothetical protein
MRKRNLLITAVINNFEKYTHNEPQAENFRNEITHLTWYNHNSPHTCTQKEKEERQAKDKEITSSRQD